MFNRKLPVSLRAVLSVGPFLVVAACGKLSHVGDLSQPAPSAIIATVAQPYTVDRSGVVQTTVRAGADVVITGTSSQKGAANSGVPIITFEWSQVNPGANAVDLIRRTSDTVSFTAPMVTSETKLTFQLTVADSNGATATATGVVTVEPIRDADHFLQFIAVDNKFTITAASSAALAATAGAAAGSDPTFTVTVTKLVSFTDINGVKHDGVAQPMAAIGTPVTYSGSWSAALGNGGTNCLDARNPQLRIPVPQLNLDDQLADGSGRLSDVLETSDVDLDPADSNIPPAVVYAQITIQSAALPSGTTPELCVNNGTAQASAVTASAEDLMTAPPSDIAPRDTSATAHAYYTTIDPNGKKTNLNDWLTANGFNPAASGYAADAHAVYTNNFDLGFGRDMYMKNGVCDGGAAALPLAQRIGKCDVAAVVVNYASVQAAANRLNPIVAVAMEYSSAPGSGARFVKFYVFAPDTRTGILQRVTSVDLDHRGQKSVPQACVVCHGGTPGVLSNVGGVPTYFNGGNVNAGFLSWDLDSFFFSDTDPGFSQKAQDAALKAQFTRAAQEAQFKLLNSGAYLTFDDPNRYALARELMEGWYGGVGLPNSSFDGTFVPAGFQPGGPNNNPSTSAKFYKDVFERNCRACHILQAPPPGIDPRTATGVDAGMNPVSACSATATTSSADSVHQVPMGCFWEFANARNLLQRLGDGQMPFARRTMDRLWVEADGSPSPGAELQSDELALSPPLTLSTPGTSIARIAFPPSVFLAQADQTAAPGVDIGNAVRLDATSSAFPDSVAWSVSACSGTPASPGQCSRALPVVGSESTLAWLLADDAVTYQLTLSLDGGTGLATQTQYFQVPVTPPTLGSALQLDLQVGASQPVSPFTAWIKTWGNGGPANNLVLLQPGTGLSISPAACATAPGCSGAVISQGIVVQSTGSTPSASSIGVTVTGQGNSPSETVSGSVAVTLLASLQAPNLPLQAVPANSGATSFDLVAAVQAQATFPNCKANSLQIASVQYNTVPARKPVVVFDGVKTLTYTPQAGFATFSSDGTAQSVPQETFAYTLQCTLANNSIETSPSMITIPVQARVSIGDAQGVWKSAGNGCSTCHGAGGMDGTGHVAPDFGHQLNALKGGSLSLDSSVPYVDLTSLLKNPPDLTSVPNSGLLCWPEENAVCASITPKHDGGLIDPTILLDVRKWIEDGANNF